MSKALKCNRSIEILDLFGIHFTDDGCLALMEGLIMNKTLNTLILANTDINP